jgi:hypothetical protein
MDNDRLQELPFPYEPKGQTDRGRSFKFLEAGSLDSICEGQRKQKHRKNTCSLKNFLLLSKEEGKKHKGLWNYNRTFFISWVVELFTGHCHLKGHLFKLRLTDDPICERCLEEDESATHILCDCEAVAYLRFRHLGDFFME